MTALTTLNTDDALPVIAKIIGGFWHGDHYNDIAAPIVPQHISGLSAILKSSDVIVRMGTIKLLLHAGTPAAIPALEDAIDAAEGQEKTWDFSELPKWVTQGQHSYSLLDLQQCLPPYGFIPRPEIELARKAISAIQARVSGNAQRVKDCTDLSLVISANDTAPILERIRTMEFDEEFVTTLLRAGIDRRDPSRWQVRGSWSEFRIKAIRSRLINGKMTTEDKAALAALLNIEIVEVHDDGVEIGHSHWQHDYWKEYLFRAWGWKPEVLGYFDSSD